MKEGEVKYGFYTPNFGYCGDPKNLVDLAVTCEESGWDGFFVWDHLQWPDMEPAADPWVALSAIATQTKVISLGPMITPLPRREIVKLAREALTLDHLSDGSGLLLLEYCPPHPLLPPSTTAQLVNFQQSQWFQLPNHHQN